MHRSRISGFTLIELMIAAAVIAILAAIAIPSYLEQSRKGRRAEAVRAVGEYQLAMERWRSENPSYTSTCSGGCSGTYPAAPTADNYTMSVNATAASGTTPSGYTVSAAPAGKQANDRCGTLSASNTAQPTWSGDADCNN